MTITVRRRFLVRIFSMTPSLSHNLPQFKDVRLDSALRSALTSLSKVSMKELTRLLAGTCMLVCDRVAACLIKLGALIMRREQI